MGSDAPAEVAHRRGEAGDTSDGIGPGLKNRSASTLSGITSSRLMTGGRYDGRVLSWEVARPTASLRVVPGVEGVPQSSRNCPKRNIWRLLVVLTRLRVDALVVDVVVECFVEAVGVGAALDGTRIGGICSSIANGVFPSSNISAEIFAHVPYAHGGHRQGFCSYRSVRTS